MTHLLSYECFHCSPRTSTIVQFIFIPPVYEVYKGYIVFVFTVTMFVCVCGGGGEGFACKLFFSSKISQELLNLGF